MLNVQLKILEQLIWAVTQAPFFMVYSTKTSTHKIKRRKTFITLNHAVFLANYQKKIDYCGLPNVIFKKILAEEFSIVWTSKEIEFPQ